MKKLTVVLLIIFMGFISMYPINNANAVMSATLATEPEYIDFRGSCVEFARKMVSSFTYEATGTIDDLASKRRLINTQTACPGYIAIVDSSAWGHVAYVESVTGSIITTLDGNWTGGEATGGRVYRRTGTQAELKILGFWSSDEANKVYFYDQHNYWVGGWNVSKNIPISAQYSSDLGFSNDQLSCIRINRADTNVLLYPDANYRGMGITIKGIGVFQLPDYMDNKCSSYKIN